jgi:hypothetical protein
MFAGQSVPFILIPHTYTFSIPQNEKFVNQWPQVHIDVIARLLQALDEHRHHNELPLHA